MGSHYFTFILVSRHNIGFILNLYRKNKMMALYGWHCATPHPPPPLLLLDSVTIYAFSHRQVLDGFVVVVVSFLENTVTCE